MSAQQENIGKAGGNMARGQRAARSEHVVRELPGEKSHSVLPPRRDGRKAERATYDGRARRQGLFPQPLIPNTRRRRFRLLPIVLLLLLTCPLTFGKPVHSYVDENGVIVYFNVLRKHVDIDGFPAFVPEEELAGIPAHSPAARTFLPSPYDSYIDRHAAAYAVDPDLIRTVMATESGFNPAAVSRRGAVGLMQLLPSTARRFGVRNIFRPDENIEGGVKYLRFLLDMFNNDLRLTLAAYNAGENLVKRLGGIPNYRETVEYVRRIVARYGDRYRPYKSSPVETSADRIPEGQRIYRTVDLLGNVVYTNRPTS